MFFAFFVLFCCLREPGLKKERDTIFAEIVLCIFVLFVCFVFSLRKGESVSGENIIIRTRSSQKYRAFSCSRTRALTAYGTAVDPQKWKEQSSYNLERRGGFLGLRTPRIIRGWVIFYLHKLNHTLTKQTKQTGYHSWTQGLESCLWSFEISLLLMYWFFFRSSSLSYNNHYRKDRELPVYKQTECRQRHRQ